jgi:hypothetical protein
MLVTAEQVVFVAQQTVFLVLEAAVVAAVLEMVTVE